MLEIQAEEGEASGHPSEPQPPPSTAQPTNEAPFPNVVSSSHQKTQTPRQTLNKVTKLPQTSELIPNVADEAVYEEWYDRVKRAATTAASLDAELASGGSPRGHTLRSGEDSIELIKELMETCTKLSKQVLALEKSKTAQDLLITKLKLRVKKLEKKRKKARTPQPMKRRLFKGRSMIEEIDQDAGVTLVQIDAEDQGRFDDETNFDVGKNVHAYTRRRRAVSTGSGGISTASRLFSTAEESVSTTGASMPVSTASMIQEVNINIPSLVVVKDKAVRLQEELDEEERQRMARVHEAAQSFTEEEWENIRARVETDEELAQRLQAEKRNKYSKVDQAKILQLRGYSFDEIKELFETTMKRVNTFVPMEAEVRGRASELAAGSSQATITDSAGVGSSKRDAEAELDHEGSKRQKTNEA
ncbi:hypothetical protein Tco_0802120 [Tanacetum coccineum]|uniref:Uncharacterized protein n=1 Tax=Tanacetum coccineum TaxID=301880 RepID=A0ABQ5A1I1_9ASTR